MRVSVKTGDVTRSPVELLAVPLPKFDSARPQLPARLRALDRMLLGGLAAALASGDFRGRAGDSVLLYPGEASKLERVLLLGLGDAAEIDSDRLRRAAGTSARRAADSRARRMAIWVPPLRLLKPAASARALTEGAILGSYGFDLYREKRDDAPAPPGSLTLFYDRLPQVAAARRSAGEGRIAADCQNLARQLVDLPANELSPATLASRARSVAREVGLASRVMGPSELTRRKLGGLLAVGQGSANPPRLIVLEHNAPRRGARRLPTLCIVGKGITFDSGGLSLKPATGMELMKDDMGGAAAVIGILRAAALLELPLHVSGIIAAAENMPGGSAYRPGDVVRTMSGKTVEVVNTDAEGRLALADALHYACSRWRPEAIVDLATLTGACQVALGPWASGIFGNHTPMIEAIRRAGETTGETAWPLPLFDGHRKTVRDSLADLRNSTGREAGASTAAAFLESFVGDRRWVHIDIAGTAWAKKASPYQPRGATGVGVRLVVEFLRNFEPDGSN